MVTKFRALRPMLFVLGLLTLAIPARPQPVLFTRVTDGPHVNDYKGSTGACWIDYDGNNYLDLYVPAGSIIGPDNNCLYRNSGDGTYSEVTGLPIVNDNTLTSSAAWADYDNDGDLDLLAA